MVLIQQGTPTVTISLFSFIPFLILIAVLIIYAARKAMKNRSDNPREPFEQTEERKLSDHLRMTSLKTRFTAMVIIIIVAIVGVIVVGQQPVHRTNIVHSDLPGDVTDADIDIVEIRSYLNGTELYLQLTVDGNIVESNATITYRYEIIVVAKGLSDDSSAYVYVLSYENGSMGVSSYSSRSYVDGATLTLVIPISTLIHGSYMIGLEGCTLTPFEEDFTPEDRDGEVAHLLF
ncbi:MAG: hypothetical protein P1Q69_05890 [Candidatus Thorarchaeota archaeon]|nr:hypothetical protein [Candidatus Thorarchaeota archaeon]